MTAVLPEIAEGAAPRPAGRHRAPEDATTGSMGVVPADRRSRSAHGRHGRPTGRAHGSASSPVSRAARTAGLSLAALGAVATAGGMVTHGLLGDEEPPATGEVAAAPELASAALAVAPAAPAVSPGHSSDAATSSVLPVVSPAAAAAPSIKHDSPTSRAAANSQETERQSARSSESSESREQASSSAGSSAAQQAISSARAQLGVPYVWGGTTPDGFDCSGLIQFAYEKAGVELPRTSRAQAQEGQEVSVDSMRPGDLIFFNEPVSHAGIYIGGGKMIEAPRTGSDVKISEVERRLDDVNTVRRVL
ncbi:C40 family peptidase [Actinomycetospora straminea]|uniref:NlpC/P60 domain-containing protein n=1 Tax=Actinomycetospora straminea TaxID=663607 RepID=A0ABP9EYN2_9PSEU|nr:C40 family peptidase [Actinomycetospora straminea]MDD7931779.1 C40 family peptidase [Actinomycetospora straminea]